MLIININILIININILKNNIKLNGVLLFGSFTHSNPTKHSDIDLAVISSDFNKFNFDKRMDFLENLRDKITDQIAMDIIGYTPREFRYIEKHSAIMAYAKKHGKWIYKEKV